MNVKSLVSGDLYSNSEVVRMASELDLPVQLIALLHSRGLTDREVITSFLSPGVSDLHDPFLFTDMRQSVGRILSAVKQKEKILIYGDYDADGVTSTAIVKRYLSSIGASVFCYIPDRLAEGYGLSKDVLDGFLSEHISLMITVDTGTTAPEEIDYAKKLGIETVVTDHHECTGSLPKCVGVINPMRLDGGYPFKGLAGVGVAFKLVCAIEGVRCPDKNCNLIAEEMLDRYGDLVALGTVADVMPMLDENRYIVKKGIERMKTGGTLGISSLIKELSGKKLELNSSTIGYRLAPHINAAGRMGRADRALELLLTDEKEEALLLSKELCNYNLQRKAEEEKILKEAYALIAKKETAQDPLTVLAGEGWHRGVLGIVAARLTERLKSSVILISLDDEYGYGSGRGIEGMDLVQLLEDRAPLLEKYGGHEQAAGLTLKRQNVERFIKEITEDAREKSKFITQQDGITVDMCLSTLDLSLPFAESLALLEPYGTGNRIPQFLLKDVRLEQITALSGGAHTKILAEKDGLFYTALLFNQKTALFPYIQYDDADLLFELTVNEYLGRRSVQLLLRRVLASGSTLAEMQIEKDQTDLLEKGQIPPLHIPDRNAFVKVYLALKALDKTNENVFSLRRLTKENDLFSTAVCKLILLIFEEQGLMTVEKLPHEDPVLAGDLLSFKLIKTDKKADIERSKLYIAARALSRG